jgi:hypothetical protein
MMRVLLVISSYKSGFPYIQDLKKELEAKDVRVNILDVENLFLIQNDQEVRISGSWFVKKMLQLPGIRTYVRTFILKRYLKTLIGQYDSVGIHSCDLIYVYLIKDLQKVSPNLTATIWGSDFYRADAGQREKKRVIFDTSRYIIFGNPVNARDFIEYYKDYRHKAVITSFGVSKFDAIREIQNNESTEALKARFGLPLDKIILALGYNGSRGQQHTELLKELSTLDESLKKRLFIVLQMTYGATEAYCKEVELQAGQTGIDYTILRNFLNDEDMARFRLSMDIVLNAQITDGFSASIQEHIYAGNILIVGDWLPYKPLELAGICYIKKPLGQFAAALTEVLERYDELKGQMQDNADKLYMLSGWNAKIGNWISIYKGEGGPFLYKENEMYIKNLVAP